MKLSDQGGDATRRRFDGLAAIARRFHGFGAGAGPPIDFVAADVRDKPWRTLGTSVDHQRLKPRRAYQIADELELKAFAIQGAEQCNGHVLLTPEVAF